MTHRRSRKRLENWKLGQSFQLPITALFFESYIVFHLLLKGLCFMLFGRRKKLRKNIKYAHETVFCGHAHCAKPEGGFEKIKLSILPVDLAFS